MEGQNMDDYVLNGVLLSSEWIKDVYPQYQFLIEIFHSYIFLQLSKKEVTCLMSVKILLRMFS